jgi:hypothetical protein
MASKWLAVVAPTAPAGGGQNSFFHRVWPALGLAVGLIVTIAWMGLLGYGIIKLF